MIKNLKKKAFTLVELLVVIAILAILATAGIVGYTSFTKKAQVSNDNSLVAELNNYISVATVDNDFNTVSEVRDELVPSGIDLSNLTPSAKNHGYSYGFNLKEEKFVLLDGTSLADGYSLAADTKTWDVFVLVATSAKATEFMNAGYSVYLQNGFDAASVTASKGVDVGENSGITAINYTNTASAQDVVIRTKGDQTVLTINAPQDDVHFYGFAKKINVTAVASSSLHIHGATNELAVKAGHVAVESTGVVFDVVQLGTGTTGAGATITNSGYVAEATLSEQKDENDVAVVLTEEQATAIKGDKVSGSTVGGDYEISTLAQLETFRDTVNAGNNFMGLTVKLTRDITLKDGWKPIGEGSRAVGKGTIVAQNTTTFFRGTFDGNNKFISNLNNKGFIPTESRLVNDNGVNTYAYGLFALVGDGAVIKNLRLTNVNIDTTTYTSAIGDSVGALIGYSDGSLTVENVEVSGSVKAGDAVGGIIGRSYNKTSFDSPKSPFLYKVNNCRNNANVTAGTNIGQKGAGIVGYISIDAATITTVMITNNTNTGTISGGATYSNTDGSSYVAAGTGERVLRASIANVNNSYANFDYSGNKNNTTNVTLNDLVAHGVRTIG